MEKKEPSSQFDRKEIIDFLKKLFEQLHALLKKLFERSRTFVRDYMEQRKAEGPKQRHKRIMARKVVAVLSHWHKLFEGMQASPQQIYSQLEQAIDKREIPGVKISRISYPEAGALSARREYLRIRRKEHVFDICAAPFGTGFFISWWLGKGKRLSWLLISLLVILLLPVLLLLIPLLIMAPFLLIPILIPIAIVVWSLRRVTYYRIDTVLMFQDSVHSAVLEVIGEVTEGKGIRALSELEKKPVLRDLFKRKLP